MKINKKIIIIIVILFIIIVSVSLFILNRKENTDNKQESTISETIKVQEIKDVYKLHSIGKCVDNKLNEISYEGITHRI